MKEQMIGVILRTFNGEDINGQLPARIVGEEGLLNYNEHIFAFSRLDITSNVVIFEETNLPYKITEKFG